DQIVPYFERQEGVASVSVEGDKTREIQLELDEANMTQHRINPQEVMEAVSNTNQASSDGSVEKGTQVLQVRSTGEITSLDGMRQTPILSESNAANVLSDSAKE